MGKPCSAGGAVAILDFVVRPCHARRAQVPSNVDGIKTALRAYEASYVTFINQPTPASGVPPLVSPKALVAWTTGSNLDDLGWGTDGDVRGSYSIMTVGGALFSVSVMWMEMLLWLSVLRNVAATTGDTVY